MKIGIYEQIINQLFEEKIALIDQTQFYIGERDIERSEVTRLLSMYLTSIFEQMLTDVVEVSADEGEEEDEQKYSAVTKGIDQANAIIQKLVNEFHLESGNLLSAQAKILTAVIDKTQSDYPDLAKRLEEMMPMKGLVNGALFTGKGIKLYSELAWDRGHYVASELSHIYTYNDARTAVILRSLQQYLTNVRNVRALGFCVDQQHAKYMAAKFTLCGLKADVLTSENAQMRMALYNRLKRKEINYLFVVDMFNEGVDIPEVDTILFLRPTESLTVFIQQFGRGLRKAEGKTHVDIFDFVGNSRAEFNYTDRMRVMIGRTSMSVAEEMERNCPHLPLGCHIILEPKAKEYIMSNIRGAFSGLLHGRLMLWCKTLSAITLCRSRLQIS